MPSPPPASARPSVIQLVFREKGALYAAYMPIFAEGGLFVPTTRDYQLGDDIYLLLTLPGDPQRYPVAGKVGWLTPANAPGGRTQGVGVRFPVDEKTHSQRKPFLLGVILGIIIGMSLGSALAAIFGDDVSVLVHRLYKRLTGDRDQPNFEILLQ